MKPDDKFPEEMLDDILDYATKARDALDSLVYCIAQLRDTYPTYEEETAMWKSGAETANVKALSIIDRVEALIEREEAGA